MNLILKKQWEDFCIKSQEILVYVIALSLMNLSVILDKPFCFLSLSFTMYKLEYYSR